MARVRNKPKESWLSKSKYEIENANELLLKRQEQLSKIREEKVCHLISQKKKP